jgi:branched-subunit amino acid ABC-type transport system permease component
LRRWLFCGAVLRVAAFFGWQYKVPGVHPLVQQLNDALGPYTLPWLQRAFGQVNPTLALLFNLAAVASILFVLSMTLIPALERLVIRDLIRRGERGARKVEAIRDKNQVKLQKKNHAR